MSAPEKIWIEPEHARAMQDEPDECNARFFECYVPIALIAEAVAREREACAKLAYDMGAKYMRATYEIQYSRKRYDIEGVTRCVNTAANLISEDIAAAIRARRGK
jgi:hypothetical protein